MTREEMLTAVIRKWGFEHPFTIRFARYCETLRCDFAVEKVYQWTMSLSVEVWDALL